MKLYLFGGAETDQGQAPQLKQLINQVINDIRPQQLLHIPYARTKVSKGEENIWGDGWVPRDLNLQGIDLLDARQKSDLARANNPTIFMNGGSQAEELYQHIVRNKLLLKLIMSANNIIGESAGSVICGAYRSNHRTNQIKTAKGFGILKDTTITAHYTEKNRHRELREVMKQTGVEYGLGIDSLTAAVIDTNTYPDKIRTIGNGHVDFVRKTQNYNI